MKRGVAFGFFVDLSFPAIDVSAANARDPAALCLRLTEKSKDTKNGILGLVLDWG